MHPAMPAGVPKVEQRTSRVSFYFAAILIFTHFARPFDTFLKGYKLPAIICSICILVMLLAGGAKGLSSKIGLSFVAMFAWMCVSSTMSYWKGGSFLYVLEFLQLFLPLMLLVAVASRVPEDVMKLCGVLAFSCLCHLVLNGSEMGGRYALNGTFGNPDDVALLAGFTIPFLVLICKRLKNSVLRYGALIVGVSYLILLIGRTATRAAIPALLVMSAVYFFRGDGVQKAIIVISISVGTVAAILVLPPAIVTRLSTVIEAFSGPDASAAQSPEGLTEAAASSAERHELVQDALETVIRHPFTGIGAGMFVQYRYDIMRRPDGSHKPYLPAHNTYLEIASECGFPGVLFYLIFLGSIYGSIRRTRILSAARTTAESDLIWSTALCLEAAFVYFAVCATFMTCDKHPHQFLLAGFAIALQRIASSQLGTPVLPAQPTMRVTKPRVIRARNSASPALAR